ncbi:hypothetical protein CPC08DRAFT_706685 [Agrocybe pediades]|nr:hypothetical protein CPC08DRAFT_706685 [Agrocybe pediades]
MPIRVAVLTVSDTASIDNNADKSGPTIKQILSLNETFELVEGPLIVPDDFELIQGTVAKWCKSGSVDWVVTTGGTGFGVRDVTPEAIGPLIERQASGLVHLLLSASLKYTPLAALSRPVAGTIGSTLVTTFPGSVKAVKENLDTLLTAGVLEHAIELIKGGSGRAVHSQLGSQATPLVHAHSHGHHHHHHHHHHSPKPRSEGALSHDPSAPVSARHRKSPYAQITLDNALKLIKDTLISLPIQEMPVDHKLGGYILAEDVYAPHNVPFGSTTSVDGYALRSSDPPGIYNVLTSQSHDLTKPLPSGSVYRINTGGPLPVGADTVIMVEDTELVSTFKEEAGGTAEEKEIKTLAQIPAGENVRAPGSDVKEGQLVMSAGERITRGGGEVGTLTFVGRRVVKVFRKPVVAIMSTGNEIVDLHDDHFKSNSKDSWGGIYDTNRPSLRAALENFGYEVIDLGIVPDEISAHVSTLKKGLESADLILTTGGTSMGPTDLLKPIIERYLDGTVHFGRVSIKPGKPTTFATVPFKDASGVTVRKQIFALPGNPASALVTFYIFVIPALRMLGGYPERLQQLPRIKVQIQNDMPLDPRTEFHRVIVKSHFDPSASPSGMILKAYSTGGQRSSRVASLCEANALVILPPLFEAENGDPSPRKTVLEKGEYAQALLIGEIEMA